jgi:hypothetical protein
MNREPIFDAVRAMLGRGFTRAEVAALDRACDLAEAAPGSVRDIPGGHRLGALSEAFESSGRGPGTVSGGRDDPGGVSYGAYQLASQTGTCAAFLRAEGKPWAGEFGSHAPGSAAFSAAWKAIAAREPDAFRRAQHAFIERTHYRPVVDAVRERTGLDLDRRADAVRDAAWSCAVQHVKAAAIVIDAIDTADRAADRSDPGYDRQLIEAIYDARAAYVARLARNPKLKPGERKQLVAITQARYPKERAKALAMLDAAESSAAPGGARPSGRPKRA